MDQVTEAAEVTELTDRIEDVDAAEKDHEADVKRKAKPDEEEDVDYTAVGDHEDDVDKKTKPNVEDGVVEADLTKTDEVVDDEWIDIIGSGDLKKKIVKEGQGIDTRPERGQLVTLRTEGHLDDGKSVDTNENVTFSLGDGDMLQAWELCLPLMEQGEVCTLTTSPRFAYGEIGRKPDVPPNANITYELELLTVKDGHNFETMPLDMRCKMADDKRERGNELFTRNDYSGAINSYTRAIEILNANESADKEGFKKLQQSKVKCYNNLAAAQIKVQAYSAARKSCDWVLSNEKDNAKALFRKGKVLASQGELTEALEITKKALKLEPSNKVIHQELSRLLAKQSEEKEKEKDLYKKMVGDMANMAESTPARTKMKNKYGMFALFAGLLAVVAAVLLQSSK
ncbi:peptidyl-prolyl cis-trans isomerase FKBP8-like [Anneissia japonica]|uniref:peptidyl-prolyl cis-trans isomerase FKBP8-like n=1 Tax=Anneissia japonica TaxID=1529436 RepID=UPI001425AEC0|nr:peptidyl-prolyl cis-trans isomerase FKBP8-like [Anneissia japonica]